MIKWPLIISVMLTNACVLFAQNPPSQETGTVREATSHYYLKNGTRVTDFMFITITYYDKTGTHQKEEETHYHKGKKQRSYTALYKDDDHLIEMRENGTLTMKNEFDSYGTIIKSVVSINRGKGTFEVAYVPKYVDGKLTERRAIQKTPYGPVESVERYTYSQTGGGIACTTLISGDNEVSGSETKCYDSNKKLVSIRNGLKTQGAVEQSSSTLNEYDKAGNLLKITQMINDQVVGSETFTYIDGKLESSTLQKGDVLIKTTYRFIAQ